MTDERMDETRENATAVGCGATGQSAGIDKVRRAFLATKREELLTPAHAIVDVSSRLLKEASSGSPHEFVTDMQRISDAGQALVTQINDILAPAHLESDETDFKTVQSHIRHDILNELNPVINYSEMWLEEADEGGLQPFEPDLQILLDSGRRCLTLLDTILESWNIETRELSQGQAQRIRETLFDEPELSRDGEQGDLLIVDDNETNCDILRRHLELQGHEITIASNGLEALELLQQYSFDLALLDIMMPEMDGMQLLSHMKSDERLRDVPVIVISALDELDLVVRCIKMGAEDYLPKPFNPVLLKARVDASLTKRRLMQALKCEKQRCDELLHVILPGEIVNELKTNNCVTPRRYDNVAVLFADIVDFTSYCDRHSPDEVVPYLQQLVVDWEESAARHGVDKIKTIGDAFMAAAGLMRPLENPVLHCIRCGLEMIETTQKLPITWNLRVGIHCGPVIGGVLGHRQYLFDLWGDTVNTAARMESHASPGSITLSAEAWAHVAQACYGTSMGSVLVKGKGRLKMIRFDGFHQRENGAGNRPASGSVSHERRRNPSDM